MKKVLSLALIAAFTICAVFANGAAESASQQKMILRYAETNGAKDERALASEHFAELVKEKTKVRQRKIYPSYVLIKMIITDESWYIVRNTKGVTGFVGPGSKPVPLTEEEVKFM